MYWKLTIWRGREFSRPYRVWFFAEGERFLSFCRCHRPRKRAALGVWGGWFKPRLEIRHATALTIGAKHWHRQKAVFYVFISAPPVFIHWTEKLPNFSFNHLVCLPKTKGGWIRISRLFCYLLWRWRGLNPRPNVELISFLHA